MNNFNELYQVHKNPWGSTPSAAIQKFVPEFKSGTVLDIGVGDGRNAIFLVQQGFRLVGLDIASEAIEILKTRAQELGLNDKVETIVADISSYELTNMYDNIVSNFTLHFIAKERFPSVLQMLQAHTEIGGLNYISDFTRDGPLYKPETTKYWLRSQELMNLYSGWEVLFYNEEPTKTRARDENGNPYIQRAATLVARRLK